MCMEERYNVVLFVISTLVQARSIPAHCGYIENTLALKDLEAALANWFV